MKNNVNATGTELMRQKEKLLTARRGHRLLKDKLDELMRQFLLLVQDATMLRKAAEDKLVIANSSFKIANAELQSEIVASAVLAPKGTSSLLVSEKNLMSIKLPTFQLKSKSGFKELHSYGFAFTSSTLDDAVAAAVEAAELFVKLAEKEKAIALIAKELERTRRRVNALEYVMIPEYGEIIHEIEIKLDEQERANIIRLIKVKDMVTRRR